MEKVFIRLKILGELHGEAVDTFLSKELETEKENVESKWLHHSQMLD